MNPPQPELVNTPQQLQTLLAHLASLDIVALDTEFHAENRYYPQLMLLQLAALDGRVWLVDPLAVDVQQLGTSLQHHRFIVHGGYEDIRILHNELNIDPIHIFDTQIAAAFLGKHYPIGLQVLLQDMLARPAAPQATLSDWSHRPLQQKQLSYAAEDAYSLIELYQRFTQLLDQQHLAWVWQASHEKTTYTRKNIASGLEWMDWGAAEILQPSAQRVLTRLMIWRDEIARKKNRPPNYILPRGIALDLARRRPQNRKELLANRRINKGLVNRHGDQLIQCVIQGEKSDQVFAVPSPAERLIANLVHSWAIAHPSPINPNLFMPKRLAIEIAMYGFEACKGWRKEAIGRDLELFLMGKSGLYILNHRPTLQPAQ